MKPNFKDRPDKALIQPELWQWTKWANDIEAELRKIFQEHNAGRYWSADILIKEILGE